MHPPAPTRLLHLRRDVLAGALNHAFTQSARLGRLLPVARPGRHGVRLERDVAWRAPVAGDPTAHLLDLWSPIDRSGPLPVILYIHGGGFRGCSKDTHWSLSIAFARAGYLVLTVNYRLGPAHRYPAALQDCLEAWAWAVANVARHGGDPARIVVAGESAGGNLTAAVGAALCWRRPEPWAQAAFDLGVSPLALSPACGILQVSDPLRFTRRKPQLPALTQDVISSCFYSYIGDHSKIGQDNALADPLLVFERAGPPDRPIPPVFLLCGTKDPLLDDTRRMAAALAARGAPHEVHYYPGQEHAFHAWVLREQAVICWRDQLRFLAPLTGAPAPA